MNLSLWQKRVFLVLRVLMGVLFLWAGWEKIFSVPAWSASGFLMSLHGPFAALFYPLAGSHFVDLLNEWGLLLLGLSLIFGILVNLSSILGSVLMFLYYIVQYPPANGLIDEHIIYIVVLVLFIVFQAGDFYSVTSRWTKNISGTCSKFWLR